MENGFNLEKKPKIVNFFFFPNNSRVRGGSGFWRKGAATTDIMPVGKGGCAEKTCAKRGGTYEAESYEAHSIRQTRTDMSSVCSLCIFAVERISSA